MTTKQPMPIPEPLQSPRRARTFPVHERQRQPSAAWDITTAISLPVGPSPEEQNSNRSLFGRLIRRQLAIDVKLRNLCTPKNQNDRLERLRLCPPVRFANFPELEYLYRRLAQKKRMFCPEPLANGMLIGLLCLHPLCQGSSTPFALPQAQLWIALLLLLVSSWQVSMKVHCINPLKTHRFSLSKTGPKKVPPKAMAASMFFNGMLWMICGPLLMLSSAFHPFQLHDGQLLNIQLDAMFAAYLLFLPLVSTNLDSYLPMLMLQCSTYAVLRSWMYLHGEGFSMSLLELRICAVSGTALVLCQMTYQYKREIARRQFTFLMNDAIVELVQTEALEKNLLGDHLINHIQNSYRDETVDHFGCVTVMFCKIVDFQELSMKIKPAKMLRLLNHLVTAFDHIVDSCGVFKVENTGGEYVAVAGCPMPDTLHAQHMANVAIKCLEAAKALKLPSGEPLEVKIGLNSGPVVASVIGEKMRKLALVGDTMNTTARVASKASSNSIHISKSTQQFIKDSYDCAPLPQKIWYKGKGYMDTFVLKGKLDVVDAAANRWRLRASKNFQGPTTLEQAMSPRPQGTGMQTLQETATQQSEAHKVISHSFTCNLLSLRFMDRHVVHEKAFWLGLRRELVRNDFHCLLLLCIFIAIATALAPTTATFSQPLWWVMIGCILVALLASYRTSKAALSPIVMDAHASVWYSSNMAPSKRASRLSIDMDMGAAGESWRSWLRTGMAWRQLLFVVLYMCMGATLLNVASASHKHVGTMAMTLLGLPLVQVIAVEVHVPIPSLTIACLSLCACHLIALQLLSLPGNVAGFLSLLSIWQTLAVGPSAYLWERTQRKRFVVSKLLEMDLKRKLRLLSHYLPQEVIPRLVDAGGICKEPFFDELGEVTVMHLDVAGFTKLSTILTPQEVSSLLNRMFSSFDRNLDSYRVMKIEIIGDAYVAISRHSPQDGARDIINFALQVVHEVQYLQAEVRNMSMPKLRKIQTSQFSGRSSVKAGELEHLADESMTVSVRIGVHTGKLVGGIVGFKRPRYLVWGQGILWAQTVEEAAKSCEVTISEDTYKYVKHLSGKEFVFTQRGFVFQDDTQPLATNTTQHRGTTSSGTQLASVLESNESQSGTNTADKQHQDAPIERGPEKKVYEVHHTLDAMRSMMGQSSSSLFSSDRKDQLQ